jgi:hypothetical protein
MDMDDDDGFDIGYDDDDTRPRATDARRSTKTRQRTKTHTPFVSRQDARDDGFEHGGALRDS